MCGWRAWAAMLSRSVFLNFTVFFAHVSYKINYAIAVAPFVVIPTDNFEEAFFAFEIILQRCQ
jgi:hypothetical protein